MKTKRIRSVVPVYAAAAAWVLWSLTLPLFRLHHILLCAGFSFLVWFIARKIWKDKIVELPADPVPETTGNEALDRFVANCALAQGEFLRMSGAIRDDAMSLCAARLSELTGKISARVRQCPEKLPKMRRFDSYFLPSAVKLADAYERMGAEGIEGENIGGTMIRIQNAAPTLISAFENQLDSLYSDEAVDISTDITVIENLMKAEGLSSDGKELK